jgi:hypothetical protein
MFFKEMFVVTINYIPNTGVVSLLIEQFHSLKLPLKAGAAATHG